MPGSKRAMMYVKLLKPLLKGRTQTQKVMKASYDGRGKTYDTVWTRSYMKAHTEKMLKYLAIRPGQRVLDLACGTGHGALTLAHDLGRNGYVLGVDLSDGMLAEARRNAELLQAELGGSSPTIEFKQGDMLETAQTLTDRAFDIITCSWAIGYSRPGAVIKEMGRILTQGGQAAVIVNIKNSLLELKEVILMVLEDFAQDVGVIPSFHFPRDQQDLERMFESAGFEIEQAWSDVQPFTFDSVDETLAWMLKAGPAAGLDASIREDRRDEVLQRFVGELEQRIEREKVITFTHRFAAVVGKNNQE